MRRQAVKRQIMGQQGKKPVMKQQAIEERLIGRLASTRNRWRYFWGIMALVYGFFCLMPFAPIQATGVKPLRLEMDGKLYEYRSPTMAIYINQQLIETGDMPAVVLKGRTLVPVREVLENEQVGASVEWNGDKQEVYVSYADQLIVLKIDSDKAYVNGKKVDLDVPAKLIQDKSRAGTHKKTMIPLRFVTENMGFAVAWNENQPYRVGLTPPVPKPTDSVTDQGITLDEATHQPGLPKLPTRLANQPIVWQADQVTYPSLIKAKQHRQKLIEKNEASGKVAESTVDVLVAKKEQAEASVKAITVKNKAVTEAQLSEPVTAVKAHFWEERLVVDILNARSVLTDNKVLVKDNPSFERIRIGQSVEEGQHMTRLVFDLQGLHHQFKISTSTDRRRVLIEEIFSDTESGQIEDLKDGVYAICLRQDEQGDFLEVESLGKLMVKPFRLSEPTRLVFDFKGKVSYLGEQSADVDGQWVKQIRTAQFEEDVTRLVIETRGHADYDINYQEPWKAIIRLRQPNYKNMTYQNREKQPPTLILKEKLEELNEEVGQAGLKALGYQNHYLKKEYVILLEGDYTDYFGTNEIKINDEVVESICFRVNQQKNTEMVIKTNRVREFRVEKEKGQWLIKMYQPSDLYDQIVVIDPGHGGKDPGAGKAEPYEKTVNLEVTLKLKEYLDQDKKIKTYYTRLDDTYPTLAERCDLANQVDADFFISIHNNAYFPSFSGTETLFLPGPDTPYLNSFELAKLFYEVFVDKTKFEGRAIKERDNLYVLKKTDMPAIILEMGFMTNSGDFALMTDKNHQEVMAKAIYEAIVKTFKEYKTR